MFVLLFCVFGFFCLNEGTLFLLGISTLRQSVNEKDGIVSELLKFV